MAIGTQAQDIAEILDKSVEIVKVNELRKERELDMNKLAKIAAAQLKTDLPQFKSGDRLKVHMVIREGAKERVQLYEGICIKRHNKGLSSSFTVRKNSDGVGVERIFPLHSPLVKKVEVLAKGRVRRAKLYYLRNLSGNAARIREEMVFQKKQEKPKEEIAK